MTDYVATPGNPVSGVTLSSGDTLVVSSGGSANVDTLLTGASGTVSASGQAVGDRVDGGELLFLAGGSAANLQIDSGDAAVQQGADVNGVVVDGGSGLFVSGTAENVTVTGVLGLTVAQGGVVSGGSLAAGGSALVEGAKVDLLTVSSGGQIIISDGGVASGTTIMSGGTFVIQNTGSGFGTLVLSGVTATVEGVASGTMVASGGIESLDADGIAVGTVISSGGEQDVFDARTSSTMIQAGGLQMVSDDGVASGTIVSAGGILSANAGVTSGVVLLLGGAEQVGEGDTDDSATTYGTVVGSGAVEILSTGGTASGTILQSGGLIVLEGGTATGIVNEGGQVVSAGVLDFDALTGYHYLGLTTTGDVIGSAETQTVFGNGGVASNSVLLSGGAQFVISGGNGLGTFVHSAGILEAMSGGTTSGATVSAGGLLAVFGGAADGTDVLASGVAGEVFGGTLSGTIVESGGLLGLVDGGEADGTDVRSGGLVAVIGATTSGTIVESGGAEGVENAGGFAAGTGSAIATIVYGGGYLVPLPGTVISGTVNSGGSVITTGVFVATPGSNPVFYPTSAINLLVDSGALAVVQAGGSLSGGTVEGSFPIVIGSGGVEPFPSSVDVAFGGIATGVTFTGLTELSVTGSAVNNVLTGSAVEEVGSGGVDHGVTLNDGTVQDVDGGGAAVGAIVTSGGEQIADFDDDASGKTIFASISGTVLEPGGTILFTGLSYTSGVTQTSFDPATGTLTVTNDDGDSLDARSLTLSGSYSNITFVTTGDPSGENATEVTAQVACYCLGTLIRTDRAEMPVEILAIGDTVVTASGEHRPIRWIGRRSYAGRFLAANPNVQPIRLRAGSLGGGLPRRDLLVSPEHAMFLDGLLVPARCLVNGTTIVQERELEHVDYFHVELDSHDIILAEGASSESFLDDDSRGMFHNAREFAAQYPDAPASGRFCAPKVDDGYELEAIRRRLALVAGEVGLAA
jgi:autotransporter passenger strand-loop-strand repeat protein